MAHKKFFTKTALLFIILVVACNLSNAQKFGTSFTQKPSSKFLFGLKFGLNLPAMIPKGADPFTNQTIKVADYAYRYTSSPFYGGVFVAYHIKNNNYAQANLSFTNNGLRVVKKTTYSGLVEDPTEVYIESPELLLELLYKRTFRSKKINAFAGIYGSYIFKNQLTSKTPLVFKEFNIDLETIQTAQLNNFDFGFALGGGCFLTDNLFLDVKLNSGVIDMVTADTKLVITPDNLAQVTPVFANTLINGTDAAKQKVNELKKISGPDGKHLSPGMSIFRVFAQIGLGWQF